MLVEFFDKFNELQESMDDIVFLFGQSFPLTVESIHSLTSSDLQRHLIAANYMQPGLIMSLRRQHCKMSEEAERYYIELVNEGDRLKAGKLKEAKIKLQESQEVLNKIINLFYLLPSLISEKERRGT